MKELLDVLHRTLALLLTLAMIPICMDFGKVRPQLDEFGQFTGVDSARKLARN